MGASHWTFSSESQAFPPHFLPVQGTLSSASDVFWAHIILPQVTHLNPTQLVLTADRSERASFPRWRRGNLCRGKLARASHHLERPSGNGQHQEYRIKTPIEPFRARFYRNRSNVPCIRLISSAHTNYLHQTHILSHAGFVNSIIYPAHLRPSVVATRAP